MLGVLEGGGVPYLQLGLDFVFSDVGWMRGKDEEEGRNGEARQGSRLVRALTMLIVDKSHKAHVLLG